MIKFEIYLFRKNHGFLTYPSPAPLPCQQGRGRGMGTMVNSPGLAPENGSRALPWGLYLLLILLDKQKNGYYLF